MPAAIRTYFDCAWAAVIAAPIVFFGELFVPGFESFPVVLTKIALASLPSMPSQFASLNKSSGQSSVAHGVSVAVLVFVSVAVAVEVNVSVFVGVNEGVSVDVPV